MGHRFYGKPLFMGQEFRFKWDFDKIKTTYINDNGYECFYNGVGEVKVHRFLYEKYHKVSLLPWVVIHHINGDKRDNRIENLKPMTPSEHGSTHHKKWKRLGIGISNSNQIIIIH